MYKYEYIPQESKTRFHVPQTLQSDFDEFLKHDIPNTVMDLVRLHDWYDQFEGGYQEETFRGEVYIDKAKSRYADTDNNVNLRASLSSDIRKGDMVINPSGVKYLLDWEIEPQSNNKATRMLRCNMVLNVFRHRNAEVDEYGYLVEPDGENSEEVIVEDLPANAYIYDGKPEYMVSSNSPGGIPNSTTVVRLQYNRMSREIRSGDHFIWGNDTLFVIDVNFTGVDIEGERGVLALQCRKDPGESL